MNIKKAIIKVFSVNFLQLLSSLLVGFVVPAILSINDYANLKTYTLYATYIGVFHFGFIDGLYIKYGGKKIDEIDKSILKGEHNFLIIFELIISIILLIISILNKNIILFLFSISILPNMVKEFHRYVNQAIGNFNKFSTLMYVYILTYIVLNLTLALLFKNTNYILYCLTSFMANLITVFIFEINFLKEYKNIDTIITKEVWNNIKIGFFILLGNLAVVALFGIDKWFIKLFLSVEEFAYYSFAFSLLNMINTLVNAISITFYNYLFENNNVEKINKLKKYLIILGSGASLAFFVLSFIVTYFIPKYIPSLNIISVTFASCPYMILINALYINLYKVNKNERKYFRVVIGLLIISIVYNVIAILLFNNTIGIASATILTLITWVIYSSNDLKNVLNEKNMYIYMFFCTIIFLISSNCFNWLIGGIIYFTIYVLLTFMIYNDVCKDLIDTIKKSVLKEKNKKER